MKTHPFFSVIVPVYNVAPYVGECLDSVLSQSCADWECLCVDDGSTDTSATLLDSYARRDPRIRIIHQPNAGVSAARNRALDTAHGQWVWFIDGDDRLREGALGMLQGALKEANDPQVAAVAFTFKEGVSFPTVWPEAKPPYVTSERTLTAWWHFRLSASRTLFRRDAIGDLRFKRYSIGEDCLFSAMFFFRISRWIMWDAPLYFYRVRQGSAMHSRPCARGVTDWFLVQRDFLDLLGADGRLDKVGGGQRVISSALGDGLLLHQWRDVLSHDLARYAPVLRLVAGQSSPHRGVASLPPLQTHRLGDSAPLAFAAFGADVGGLAALVAPCVAPALSVKPFPSHVALMPQHPQEAAA